MSDRIRTVDMSNPAVVLDCYRKLNIAYKELKKENEKLRAALKPFVTAPPSDAKPDDYDWLMVRPEDIRAAAAALRETNNV